MDHGGGDASAAGAPTTAAAVTTLDLRGLKCPLPVLKTRRALARMADGDELDVRCTDALAALDIPNLVRETGDTLVLVRLDAGESRFRIRRVQAAPIDAGSFAEDPSATGER